MERATTRGPRRLRGVDGRRLRPPLALAHRILRDVDRSRRAVQECLIRAWRDLRGAARPRPLRCLALPDCSSTPATTRSRSERRRGPQVIRVLPLDAGRLLATPRTTWRTAIELERGFRRLNIDQRAVLVMHHYLGMRPPEIAETLGIPVGTVHSRLQYATRAMRAVLEADARRPWSPKEGGRHEPTVIDRRPAQLPGSRKDPPAARTICCRPRMRARGRHASDRAGSSHSREKPWIRPGARVPC